MMKLPATPADFLREAVDPGLALLPSKLDSIEARVWLTTIALQESALAHRWQIVDARDPSKKGPARGLLQFELGSEASRGGVWGVYLHWGTQGLLKWACDTRGVQFEPRAIWEALESDDALAVALGRLLMLTDPYPLPAPGDVDAGWEMYAHRLWRPGRPHFDTWPGNHEAALRALDIT